MAPPLPPELFPRQNFHPPEFQMGHALPRTPQHYQMAHMQPMMETGAPSYGYGYNQDDGHGYVQDYDNSYGREDIVDHNHGYHHLDQYRPDGYYERSPPPSSPYNPLPYYPPPSTAHGPPSHYYAPPSNHQSTSHHHIPPSFAPDPPRPHYAPPPPPNYAPPSHHQVDSYGPPHFPTSDNNPADFINYHGGYASNSRSNGSDRYGFDGDGYIYRPHEEYSRQDYLHQGFPPQGYPRQESSRQGVPSEEYPRQEHTRQGFPPQDHPPHDHPPHKYPPQAYPRQDFPRQGVLSEEYPRQDYPRQEFPPPLPPKIDHHSYYTEHFSHNPSHPGFNTANSRNSSNSSKSSNSAVTGGSNSTQSQPSTRQNSIHSVYTDATTPPTSPPPQTEQHFQYEEYRQRANTYFPPQQAGVQNPYANANGPTGQGPLLAACNDLNAGADESIIDSYSASYSSGGGVNAILEYEHTETPAKPVEARPVRRVTRTFEEFVEPAKLAAQEEDTKRKLSANKRVQDPMPVWDGTCSRFGTETVMEGHDEVNEDTPVAEQDFLTLKRRTVMPAKHHMRSKTEPRFVGNMNSRNDTLRRSGAVSVKAKSVVGANDSSAQDHYVPYKTLGELHPPAEHEPENMEELEKFWFNDDGEKFYGIDKNKRRSMRQTLRYTLKRISGRADR